MGCLTVCLLVLFGLSGWTAATSLVGGWSAKPLDGDPKYAELAHYAVSTKTDGLENYDTVLELVGVRTQVRTLFALSTCTDVFNYFYVFEFAESGTVICFSFFLRDRESS